MSKHTLANGKSRIQSARYHPLAVRLIENHNQSDWAIREDGLICAPVGFYRIMDLYEKDSLADSDSRKTLVFGFLPQDLDLVPHPEHPEYRILKNPAYILPPVETDFVEGWAENEMRRHQGQWLAFALGYSNLYQTAKGNDEYFSNNFVAYRLFPAYDIKGAVAGYNVGFRINSFQRSYGAGLEQDRSRTPIDWLWRRGVVLKKDILTREEAVQAIHRDFRERYMSFLKGEEVQHWTDPDKAKTVAMWITNRMSDINGKPLSIGNALAKFIEMVLAKFKPSDVIVNKGMDMLDESASEEKRSNRFNEIAEVSEDSPAPINSMKEDVRNRCVAVPAEDVRKYIYTDFPACTNMEARYCNRALDIIHGVEPAIVAMDEKSLAVTVRSHYGIEIHRLPNSRLYITYAPDPTAQKLPLAFETLFTEGKIAQIRFAPFTKTPALEAGQDHEASHCSLRGHLDFRPTDEIAKELSGYPRVLLSVCSHRHPAFVAAADQVTAAVQAKPSMKDLFKPLWPFFDAPGQKDLNKASVFLALGAVLEQNPVLRDRFGVAAPWLFAISAALITRRVRASALTAGAKKYLDVAAQGLFALGPLLFICALGVQMVRDFRQTGRLSWDDDTIGKLAGLVTSGAIMVRYCKKTAAVLCRKLPPKPAAAQPVVAAQPTVAPQFAVAPKLTAFLPNTVPGYLTRRSGKNGRAMQAYILANS